MLQKFEFQENKQKYTPLRNLSNAEKVSNLSNAE